VLGPLLFLAYIKDIWRLFADECIIYRRINDSSDVNKLQLDLNKLREWASVSKMKINPGKSKSVSFTKGRVRERINYYFGDQFQRQTVVNI
jgi:nucleoid-associated protein YejK